MGANFEMRYENLVPKEKIDTFFVNLPDTAKGTITYFLTRTVGKGRGGLKTVPRDRNTIFFPQWCSLILTI